MSGFCVAKPGYNQYLVCCAVKFGTYDFSSLILRLRGHDQTTDIGGVAMRILMTALGLAALTTPATAADLTRKAPPAVPVQQVQIAGNWAGLYVGVHGGYSWGRWDGDLYLDPGTGPVQSFSPSRRTIDADGWLAGGQIGFNHQFNSFVLGLEADASWTNLKGNGTFSTPGGVVTWAIETQLDWFATVRGRAGFAVNNFLFYGTGGVAFGRTNGSEVVTQLPGPVLTAIASTSGNHIGWTAGAGVEWMYTRNWSFKAEYLYVDLGSADYRFIGQNLFAQSRTRPTVFRQSHT